MGKAFRIIGMILTTLGLIGVLALIFKVGISPSQGEVMKTYGAIEFTLVVGLILQVLYKVTEGEL